MKFGYLADTNDGAYNSPPPGTKRCVEFCESLLEEATAAEESGFDGVFVPERHGRTETIWPSPLMAVLAMALKTRRIRVGTCVLQPAYYHPTHLAEQAALVDLLSHGRLVLGLGVGYNKHYFAQFGAPFTERVGRFLESIEFLEKAWRDDEFRWDGKYWQMETVRVTPKPYQRPHPPMWFAATTERTARRAGRLADGAALLSFYLPIPQLRGLVDAYRVESIEAGRIPTVALLLDGFVAPSYERAKEVFGLAWVEEVRYFIERGLLPSTEEIPSLVEATFERLEKYMFLGGRDECAATIDAYRSGLDLKDGDWIIVRFRVPNGPDSSAVRDAIQAFGQEVIPIFEKIELV